MKITKIIVMLGLLTGTMQAYTVKAVNYAPYKVAVDFLDSTGNSHANMLIDPDKGDERDIGGWCTEKVRVTVIKPNGGYGGIVEVKTPGKSCDSFVIGIGVYAPGRQARDVPRFIENSYLIVQVWNPGDRIRDVVISTGQDTSNYYSLPHLLNVTTQSSIITNGTNAEIKLFNAPSLGTGATDGVPVAPGATIPFYLNAGSAGEELLIKGNGAGTVSFGNDYAKHKTTMIASKNIKGATMIGSTGIPATTEIRNSSGELVIAPLRRLDVTTLAGDWEIKLKVAEEIK